MGKLFEITSGEELVVSFLEIAARMKKLRSLLPCSETDTVFQDLVAFAQLSVRDEWIERFFQDTRVKDILPEVRSLSSQAEYELEKYFATQKNGREILELFPYTSYYRDLVLQEASIIRAHTSDKSVSKLLFIGSGPLPLSSHFYTHYFPSIQITNLDFSSEAIALGEGMLENLNSISSHCSVCKNITSHEALEEFDVLLLAALAGQNYREKAHIAAHIAKHMKPGALLLVRSVAGLKKILYPEAPMEIFERVGLTPLSTVLPHNHLINSFTLFRK